MVHKKKINLFWGYIILVLGIGIIIGSQIFPKTTAIAPTQITCGSYEVYNDYAQRCMQVMCGGLGFEFDKHTNSCSQQMCGYNQVFTSAGCTTIPNW